MSPKKEDIKAPGIDSEGARIKFDFIKSNHFRVIHVDGVFGGPSPGGNGIFMSVWNERWPIPKQITHELGGTGQPGDEIRKERIARDAIVREVEVGLVMNIEVAKKIREWLDDKIKAVEKVVQQPQKGEEK